MHPHPLTARYHLRHLGRLFLRDLWRNRVRATTLSTYMQRDIGIVPPAGPDRAPRY